jgi:hypothetical protein
MSRTLAPLGLSLAAGLFLLFSSGCGSKTSTPDMKLPSGGDMGPPDDLATSDQPPDAGLPTVVPATVWTSVGGGSGVGSATGSILNITVGGSSVAGAGAAPSGASVTFGYFTDDNH